MNYEIANGIREMQKLSKEGYVFVAAIDPDRWLVVKYDDGSVTVTSNLVDNDSTATNFTVKPSITTSESAPTNIDVPAKITKKDGK